LFPTTHNEEKKRFNEKLNFGKDGNKDSNSGERDNRKREKLK
jgi:hypothetical protein